MSIIKGISVAFFFFFAITTLYYAFGPGMRLYVLLTLAALTAFFGLSAFITK